MTDQTPNSKIAGILEQMAESYYPEHEYNDMWRERNAELVAVAATQLQQLMIEQRQDELDRMEKAALKGTSKPFTMYEYSVKRRKEIKETE